MRAWVPVGVLAASALVGLGVLASQQAVEAASLQQVRVHDDIQLAAGVTLAEALALDAQPEAAPPGRLASTHPADGAVWPRAWPSPTIRWTPVEAGHLHRVTASAGGRALTALTRADAVRFSPEAWAALVEGAETVEVTLRGALVDGRQARSAVWEGPTATIRLAHGAEAPRGALLYGAKFHPPGSEGRTTPLMFMHLAILGLDMADPEPTVLFQSSYGPERFEGSGGGSGDPSRQPPRCVSCHDVSADGSRVAIFSQIEAEAPADFDAPNGFLTVLAMPEREVLVQLPHAFMPVFSPTDADTLLFTQVDETIGAKTQMLLPHGDIHVLDLQSGQHRPLAGASEPRHVENFPAWSPDGQTVAFVRAARDEIMHGAESVVDIYTVPFNQGEGGAAAPLVGASHNGRSNFYPVFDPSSRWVVFTQADSGFFSQISSDLYAVPAEGGAARRLSCNSDLAETWHRFSPDGQWLALVSNREDVREPDVLVARFDAGTGDCAEPVETPFAAGEGAHVHAFAWSERFDWLDDGLPVAVLASTSGPVATNAPPRTAVTERPVAAPAPSAEPLGDDPVPPGVQTAFDDLAAALSTGDEAAVGALFFDRAAFLAVSDCDPPTIVDNIISARRGALQRATAPAPVTALRVDPGRLQVVPKGEKPVECRALVDVRLFQTTWSWQAAGRAERGEAHLLEVDGVWRFVKL